MLRKLIAVLLFVADTLVHSSKADAQPVLAEQCRFIGIRELSSFTAGVSSNADESVLLSPVIRASMLWDELVVSWNADAPAESWLKVEARGIFTDHETKFYTMGIWSRDLTQHPRTSVRGQKDTDGTVNADTLVLARPGADVQLRLTLGGPSGALRPQVKFLGLSFLDTRAQATPLPPNRAAWGKIIATPELSQNSHPKKEGWCSPTCLAMVLTRWSEVLHRPDLKVDVPEVAAGVYDGALGGTGNWPFNTAYAGSFSGLRACVARFSDLSEVEDWIAVGIPVVLSARWDLLAPGRKPTGNGHLVVCIGFMENGDVVVNDPATNLQKGQKVRHIYTRQNVINAWKQSHNTVYLVYPETARIPTDRFGHWERR